MIKQLVPLVSVVVPVYNEEKALKLFHESLLQVLRQTAVEYEVVYCDDGSTDGSPALLREWANTDKRVRLLRLSRNFGKEIATTAGIHAAHGEAIITLDADGQHPVELIPEFLRRWQNGDKVVIGVRTRNHHEGTVKRYGSKLFYRLFNRFAKIKLVPGATDFRLIDSAVQAEFRTMTERNRITRGLIDWLGYEQTYIHFAAKQRLAGEAGYSFNKLLKLAIDSIISMSISPLYIPMYLGLVVLPLSALLGLFMLGNFLLGDPAGLRATAGAYIAVFTLFLVGILLTSQGIIGLYLSHIHTETQNRPLYIVDKKRSIGIDEHDTN